MEKARVALNKKITQKENSQELQNTIADFLFILDLCGFKFELPPYSSRIKLLIHQWQELVQAKKYPQADQIRNELIKNSIIS